MSLFRSRDARLTSCLAAGLAHRIGCAHGAHSLDTLTECVTYAQITHREDWTPWQRKTSLFGTDSPPGMTNDEPVPYGYRRWNGVVWADSWTDTYNAISRQAVIAWRQGFDSKAEQEVEAMYRMAAQFDQLGKELAEKD